MAEARHAYLRSSIREWLTTSTARSLADGEPANGGPAGNSQTTHVAGLLGLRFADANVRHALTPSSRQRLARLIANPDQAVCYLEVHDEHEELCDRVHVDVVAIADPTTIARVEWHELPPELAARWGGPHHRGRITIYRDLAGEEWAEWADHEPTVGGAWDQRAEIPLEEARRLVEAARRSGEEV